MTGMEWIEFLNNHPTTELKQKLDNILLSVSWKEFANDYMEKDSHWLHEKIDGYTFEGNSVEPMNDEELHKFQNGLFDLCERIKRVAESLG